MSVQNPHEAEVRKAAAEALLAEEKLAQARLNTRMMQIEVATAEKKARLEGVQID